MFKTRLLSGIVLVIILIATVGTGGGLLFGFLALISLIGLRSPTADLSTEAAWAVVVFIMITAQKIKTSGFGGYLKGFTTPIAVMTPFNILSELATPVSMACRHFGNILSGVVINGLIYGALAVASSALLGLIPGVLGDVLSKIPILDVGVPAITSVYIDWFSGVMQAFIFCMLTKLRAAQIASAAGVDMVIANGADFHIIHKITEGRRYGTLFVSQSKEEVYLIDIIDRLL